jgi:hypothetical protein
MSRLESVKKAGYYPTPVEVAVLIAGHLKPPEQEFRWLDPCCGEGTALKSLAQALGGQTYGIELDAERAEEAREKFDHVRQGDYATQQLPKGKQAGISTLFLNPPYDQDDRAGKRLELAFLRDTQEWLMAGGVLIYIIPQGRITPHVAARLATHFEQVRVYRFPGASYDSFRQVVIFAVKRGTPQRDDRVALAIAQAKATRLPELPPETEEPYQIPPVPEGRFYFRSAEVDPREALAEAFEAGVWQGRAWADALTPADGMQAVRPLMPLRRGHIAMALAAGLLDNTSIARDGGKRFLVKGRLRKVQEDVTTDQDRENEVKRQLDKFQTSITVLDLEDGTLTTLKNEAELRAWLTEWQDVLAARIVEEFEPLHDMTYEGLGRIEEILDSHSRYRHLPGRTRTGLFEAQRQVVAALTRRFLAGADFAILQATMGTGKTSISISTADVLKKLLAPKERFPVIVVCPPHLVEKWPREIAEVVPMARGMVLRRCRDVDAYFRQYQRLDPRTLCVAVVSSEMLKLGSGWTAAVVRKRGRHRAVVTHEDGTEELQRLDTFACPRCGGTLYHRDEAGKPTYPVTEIEYFTDRPRKCDNRVRRWQAEPESGGVRGRWVMEECGEPLYQNWRGQWIKPRNDGFGNLLPPPPVRYPIADYIRRRYRGRFQLAIVDEVHEMKGQSTDRGYAFATLASACPRTLCLTGTLFGGMATSLFYLLHRLDGRVRAEFAWNEGQRFASLYGVLERLVKGSEIDYDDDEYGVYSGKRRRSTHVVERPGISPALVPRLLDSTGFLTLEDLGFELPSYREQPVVLEMVRGNGRERDQAEVYEWLSQSLLAAAREDRSLMAEYLQTTLAWPNAPWRDEETSVGVIPALPADRLYPKEQWLVDKCLEEKSRGRRVLLFVRQTGTRDIQPRLRKLLKQAGLRAVVLRSTVPPQRREAWLKRHVKQGLNVLICNPRLVQTGLDLVDFATSVFYEIEYSVYLVQQASRRTWRLGQTQPVEIYFPIYAGTMEHRAVAHVGRKVAAAQLLYGDDIAGALVQEAGVDYGFLESLAREVVENTALPDLGQIFISQSRQYEGAGWLTGHSEPGLEEEVAQAVNQEMLDLDMQRPISGVQLSLF